MVGPAEHCGHGGVHRRWEAASATAARGEIVGRDGPGTRQGARLRGLSARLHPTASVVTTGHNTGSLDACRRTVAGGASTGSERGRATADVVLRGRRRGAAAVEPVVTVTGASVHGGRHCGRTRDGRMAEGRGDGGLRRRVLRISGLRGLVIRGGSVPAPVMRATAGTAVLLLYVTPPVGSMTAAATTTSAPASVAAVRWRPARSAEGGVAAIGVAAVVLATVTLRREVATRGSTIVVIAAAAAVVAVSVAPVRARSGAAVLGRCGSVSVELVIIVSVDVVGLHRAMLVVGSVVTPPRLCFHLLL